LNGDEAERANTVTQVPRLVIAAPASGSGKTTVATGLMAALTAKGVAVSPHKVGPDYIDPGYHALATGRPGRNLDPWLTGAELIAPLLLHGARGADIAIVEGVMGLYDGAARGGPTSHSPRSASGATFSTAGYGDFASTAHVARLLDAPVVLVVDAAAAGRSVAALVHGFRTFGDVPVGGVILNRIGSDRHADICRAAIEELGLPVLGVLRRRDDVATPARHLGLIPTAERRAEATGTVDRLAALVAESCDLPAILALARSAPPLTAARWDPAAQPGRDLARRRRSARTPLIAVAGGAAFTFGYAENAELLAAAGAQVVRFDPLRDEALPDGARGLVIGGGFPEVYAAELSANESLRTEIAALDPATPMYAECAGLLYLAKALDGAPMCGVLDATAAMTRHLTLGYRSAVAVSDSVVARAGERVRGHEFHRTTVTPGHGDRPAWQWSAAGPEGFARRNCLASYLHLHWAGSPYLAGRFTEACR
jgi:cobyrinic acid a,c-diamide synthase